MSKFLIITDSNANPRSFPVADQTQLEETYPYLVRDQFKEATFWQLSYGNITTEQLCSQAISYLNQWNPDIIIIHSGICDSRPEAFSEFQKNVISKFTWILFNRIKKYVYHPSLIKRRQVYRVSKRSFRKTLRKIKLIFTQSKIYWIEICAGNGYEEIRPGVNRRMEDYNKIIEEIYGEDFVLVKEKILEVNGFNVDNLHLNKRGHKAVADILLKEINLHFNNK